MKRFLRFGIVLISLIAVLAVSCGSKEGDLAKLGPSARYEYLMVEEAKNIPDFSVKVIEDPNLKVEGMPEQVVWLTANMPDYGSPQTKKGGTLHISESQFAENYRFIGPQGNHSQRSYMYGATSLMWSSDETKEWLPVECSHWAFGADNQTVYYKLREEIKWSDGTPCTADDYVWAWQMWLDPNLDAPWYNKYGAKFEVKKINDYCIAIKWLESDKLSKYELIDNTNFVAYSKKFFNNGQLYKNWHVDFNWKYSPTIRPYVLDEEKTVKGELMVFKRVKDWWGDSLPYFKNVANYDYIEVKIITGGAEVEKEYFYKGELDVFGLTRAQYWNEASTNPMVTNGYVDRWILNYEPTQGMQGFFMNVKSEFFKDRKVRYAMYYAFDMQGMIDNILQGEVKRYHNTGIGQLWAGADFNDRSIRKPDFDPVKAGELLAEAGYDTLGPDGIRVNKEGKRASFELLYGGAAGTEQNAYLKEQAKKAGVEVELKLLEQGWIEKVFAKDYDMVSLRWSYNLQPSYWQFFSSEEADREDSNNIVGYASPEMDALLKVEDDPDVPIAEKAENNKKIERLVHEEALVIPTYYTDFTRVGVWKWLKFPAWGNQKFTKGLLNQDDPTFFYNYGWIDSDVKAEVEAARADGKTFEPKIWKPSTRYLHE